MHTRTPAVAVVVLVAALCALAAADIVDVSVRVKRTGMADPIQQMGMFARHDSPWGDDEPYVQLRGTVLNAGETNTTLMLLVVADSDLTRVVEDVPCERRHRKMVVVPGEQSVGMTVGIPRTSWYQVLLIECPGVEVGLDAPQLEVRGEVVSRNTFGYIPASMYHLLPFFGIVCLLYMVVGVAWFVLTVMNWSQSLQLQHCIAGVIALGFWEFVFRYFDLWEYNHKGRPNLVTVMFAVLLGNGKETVSRMLVLSVSMGYGVVKPSLGTDKFKVLVLGAVFFVTDAIYSLNQRLGGGQGQSKPSFAFAVAVIIPQALANALFFYWTFIALARCMHHLESRQQHIKLTMYKTFAIALGIALVVSLILLTIHAFVGATLRDDMTWRFNWAFEAYWELLYFAVLLVVCVIWRPSDTSFRYRYQQTDDDDFGASSSDEEVNVLVGVSEPMRRTAPAPPKPAGGPPPPSRPADGPRTATSLFTAAAFAIHEDEETELLEANKME